MKARNIISERSGSDSIRKAIEDGKIGLDMNMR